MSRKRKRAHSRAEARVKKQHQQETIRELAAQGNIQEVYYRLEDSNLENVLKALEGFAQGQHFEMRDRLLISEACFYADNKEFRKVDTLLAKAYNLPCLPLVLGQVIAIYVKNNDQEELDTLFSGYQTKEYFPFAARNALHYLAQYGRSDAVNVLVPKVRKFLLPLHDAIVPIHGYAQGGHEQLVFDLLKNYQDEENSIEYIKPAFHGFGEGGHEGVIDRRLKDYASEDYYVEVVRSALEGYKQGEHKDKFSRLLTRAVKEMAEAGKERDVNILLTKYWQEPAGKEAVCEALKGYQSHKHYKSYEKLFPLAKKAIGENAADGEIDRVVKILRQLKGVPIDFNESLQIAISTYQQREDDSLEKFVKAIIRDSALRGDSARTVCLLTKFGSRSEHVNLALDAFAEGQHHEKFRTLLVSTVANYARDEDKSGISDLEDKYKDTPFLIPIVKTAITEHVNYRHHREVRKLLEKHDNRINGLRELVLKQYAICNDGEHIDFFLKQSEKGSQSYDADIRSILLGYDQGSHINEAIDLMSIIIRGIIRGRQSPQNFIDDYVPEQLYAEAQSISITIYAEMNKADKVNQAMERLPDNQGVNAAMKGYSRNNRSYHHISDLVMAQSSSEIFASTASYYLRDNGRHYEAKKVMVDQGVYTRPERGYRRGDPQRPYQRDRYRLWRDREANSQTKPSERRAR